MSWFRPKTLLALLLTGLLFSTGCQNKSSHSGPPAAADPEEAIVIGILLPARGFSELSVWESVAHLQEAPTRSAARVYKMGPTDLPAQQNEQIKQAVTEGCSALIILAADPASIASVVGEVRKAGTPVVILDNPIPNSEGLPAAAFITYEDEVSSVKKLVAAAQAAAKEAGFPADGPAQILSHAEPTAAPHFL